MPSALDRYFADGTLVRPRDDYPNLVHLIRAIAHLTGVPNVPVAPPTRAIIDHIGPADHLVFILIDGLGINIVRDLPRHSFIARHLRMELHSTCPSTTGCALTTVATAEYPNRHGITGWFTYLPHRGYTVATLPFVERMTSESLAARGLRAEDVLPLPPICPRMTHRALTLVPTEIANST